jgi:uncharacterized short protein YbdD (DUF466 family)
VKKWLEKPRDVFSRMLGLKDYENLMLESREEGE